MSARALPERGSFWWCVRTFDLGSRPLTAIGRLVCERWSVWPEQLVGRERAHPAVSRPDAPPLSTGHTLEPSRRPHVVHARRYAWCLARVFTNLPAADLAEAFGGYSSSSVYDAWRHAEDFGLAGLLLLRAVESEAA